MRALVLMFALAGCCALRPSVECEAQKYAVGVTNKGAPARCADAVWIAADTLLPDPALRPLHGVIVWHTAPFYCTMTQKVWGCVPDITAPFVNAAVVNNGVHAGDTALPEEIAHWVWARCYPTVQTEWYGPDGAFHRDPAFEKWFSLVADTARSACP
jgi:hypothetical protein